jgi:hypothetical protein
VQELESFYGGTPTTTGLLTLARPGAAVQAWAPGVMPAAARCCQLPHHGTLIAVCLSLTPPPPGTCTPAWNPKKKNKKRCI